MSKAINVAKRKRDLTKGIKPYATWTDRNEKVALIQSNEADQGSPYARWTVVVDGDHDYPVTLFASQLLPGLLAAKDLKFDTDLWANETAFLVWARGSSAGFTLAPGDKIRVRIGRSTEVDGTVISAINYGGGAKLDNWYIELNDNAGRYRYFKQEEDKGIVFKL